MDIVRRLKRLMEINNDSVASLSRKSKLPYTTVAGLFERGCEKAQVSTMSKISNVYGVTLDYLINGADKLSEEALVIASKFDMITDSTGRDLIKSMIDHEVIRCKAAPERIVRLCRFTSPSAAGAPNPAEGDYEYVDYPYNDATVRADFAVGIQGESMLPALEDGCTVFVSTEERISDGDIVIAWLEGEGMVCKRVMMDGERLKMLESINPDFDSYAGYDLHNVRIFGKVVGNDM